MVGVGKLQAENVFSLFAILKFGISADIIKNPIGPLMIIYFLQTGTTARLFVADDLHIAPAMGIATVVRIPGFQYITFQ